MDHKKNTIEGYVNAVASREVSPGGGSASALLAALGAGLNLMVINFGIRPGQDADARTALDTLKSRQNSFKNSALSLINEDCEVFEALMKALNEKNADDGHYTAAADVPVRICRTAYGSMKIARETLTWVKGFIVSDLACSNKFLSSAFFTSELNALMNISKINCPEVSSKLKKELADMREDMAIDRSIIEGELINRGILKKDKS